VTLMVVLVVELTHGPHGYGIVNGSVVFLCCH